MCVYVHACVRACMRVYVHASACKCTPTTEAHSHSNLCLCQMLTVWCCTYRVFSVGGTRWRPLLSITPSTAGNSWRLKTSLDHQFISLSSIV